MKAYLPVVLDKETKEVCMDPSGAYEEYVGAMHALLRQQDYVKEHPETHYGKPIIVELEVDASE